MSAEERLQSGVDTLTAEQRKFLNNWLKENYGRRTDSAVARTTADKQSKSTEQPAKLEATPEAIEAEVDRRVAAKLANKRESEKAKQSNSAFEARLTGDFTGWTGKPFLSSTTGRFGDSDHQRIIATVVAIGASHSKRTGWVAGR